MNNHGLEYERIGQLRSIAMQRIAEGSGKPAEALLELANDIEALLRERDEWKARAAWNALPRALTWTRDPQLGAWNWWRDEYSCIPRYVYQDGTVAITMLIARVPYQDLGGQWAGPIPEPREPK